MLKKLLSVLNRAKDDAQPTLSVEQASAALLYMLATADNDFDEREKDAISRLTATDDTSEEEREALRDKAKQAVQDSTSIYEFTATLNEAFDYHQRVLMVQKLWDVAYADGKLDKYEEYLIRRVCDLLYVAHSDFIQSRNQVRDRRD